MNLKPLAAAIAAILTIPAAHAGPEISAVFVTATRFETPQRDVLAPTLVIERDELGRSAATDVTDVLRFHAGIDIARNGGVGQTASAFIRGAESNHTLVLVDGVRLNPGTIGAAALQNLTPAMIERIEIVKGPRSTLYGTDAIGGVIQIFTRAQGANDFTVDAGWGSFDTFSAATTAGWRGERAHGAIAVSWFETDGFAPRKIDRRGGAHDDVSFNVSGGVDAGPGELFAQFVRAEGATDYIGFSNRTFTPALITQDHISEAGSAGYAFNVDAWHTRIRATTMLEEYAQGTVQDADGRFESPDLSRTRRNGIEWENDLAIDDNHRLVFGGSYAEENARTVGFTSFDVDTQLATAYLQDHATLGRNHIVLGAGYTDHESFGGHTTWTAEYGYDLREDLRLLASGGSAFRAPDATDRFGFGGNPDLRPEKSRNLELGLRYLPLANHTLSFSAFQNEIDQLISVEMDPVTFDFVARNVDRARIRGVEVGYAIAADKWQWRAEAIYQEPEDLSTGTRLIRRSQESLSMSATRTFGRFGLTADVLFQGDRTDFGGVTLDSYTLFNLSATARVTDAIELYARIENVFDDQYELIQGYNTADRSAFVGLRFKPGTM